MLAIVMNSDSIHSMIVVLIITVPSVPSLTKTVTGTISTFLINVLVLAVHRLLITAKLGANSHSNN